MDIIYLTNLALVGICAVSCVNSEFKRTIFKAISFAYTSLFLVCVASKCNKLLLPDFNSIDVDGNLLEKSVIEKINSTVITLVGTIILIISLNIMLKQMFKIVDGRFERSIYVEIMDRIRGAVDGLFVLYKIGNISLDSHIENPPCEITVRNLHDEFIVRKNIDIYKLVRNLN